MQSGREDNLEAPYAIKFWPHGQLMASDPDVLDSLVTCDESWIYCYDPETMRQSAQ